MAIIKTYLIRHSKKAFSQLKEKLDVATQFHFQLNFSHKTLTKAEKKIIKDKIRNDEKIRMRKVIIVFTLIIILILFLIKFLIDSLMINN